MWSTEGPRHINIKWLYPLHVPTGDQKLLQQDKLDGKYHLRTKWFHPVLPASGRNRYCLISDNALMSVFLLQRASRFGIFICPLIVFFHWFFFIYMKTRDAEQHLHLLKDFSKVGLIFNTWEAVCMVGSFYNCQSDEPAAVGLQSENCHSRQNPVLLLR